MALKKMPFATQRKFFKGMPISMPKFYPMAEELSVRLYLYYYVAFYITKRKNSSPLCGWD